MNKSLYLIIAILALGILAALISFGKKQAPTPLATTNNDITTATSDLPSPEVSATVEADSSPAATTTTVTYTNTGFSPATITIKAGETVQFVNNSSSQMWVASDPHPSHTGLTGFDAKKGYKQGETYSFTFTKAGTFGYHNHLSDSNDGTIIVQ